MVVPSVTWVQPSYSHPLCTDSQLSKTNQYISLILVDFAKENPSIHSCNYLLKGSTVYYIICTLPFIPFSDNMSRTSMGRMALSSMSVILFARHTLDYCHVISSLEVIVNKLK